MILITAAVCTLPERLKKNWAQITKFHYCMQMLHDAPRCTFRRLLRSTSEEATLPQGQLTHSRRASRLKERERCEALGSRIDIHCNKAHIVIELLGS
jgi:hypothetical protein